LLLLALLVHALWQAFWVRRPHCALLSKLLELELLLQLTFLAYDLAAWVLRP